MQKQSLIFSQSSLKQFWKKKPAQLPATKPNPFSRYPNPVLVKMQISASLKSTLLFAAFISTNIKQRVYKLPFWFFFLWWFVWIDDFRSLESERRGTLFTTSPRCLHIFQRVFLLMRLVKLDSMRYSIFFTLQSYTKIKSFVENVKSTWKT